MSSKGQAWLKSRSQPAAPADMPAASSGDAYGSSNSIGGVAVTPHPPAFPMPGFAPQWPCGPAGSLANMGITIPPRMQPPQLQLGNGSRMQMPQPQPPSQTAAIEMGVQFGMAMCTLQHTCQQQAGALQQQADRLDLLEACQMSEPTCDYHTDTLKQEGLLKQGGLLFCRLHLSHAGASFIGANALHVLNYMMSGILSPDGIQQATPRAQNQTAPTALQPRSRRLANDQEPQFFIHSL